MPPWCGECGDGGGDPGCGVRCDLRETGVIAVDAATGFADRLAQFWSSHFSMRATGAHARIMIESFLEDVIRAHQLGRFADLLKAATTHQAMLTYLDQTSSVGPGSRLASRRSKPMGLNENHARELLELHTLGVGDAYSQQDVRQLAELMTGLIVAKDHDLKYDINRAEPGTETVLGKEYGGATPPELAEVEAFLDDLAIHPGTARFISTKLARHFCADIPPADLVEAMTRRFSDTDGDLMAVYEVMVSHPAAQDSFGQKVRQPFDYVASSLRALGVPGQAILAIEPRRIRNDLGAALAEGLAAGIF